VSGPRLVLVGPPGAGKTSVGRLLCARLGVGFRDTDADVEATAGKTIADLFVDAGEPAFRALETAALRQALAEHPGVLALGGGAVLAPENRVALRGRAVVFLSVELADAVRRTGLDQSRPLLALNPRATLRTMLADRRPLYDEVATVTVPTDGRTPDEVADAVLTALEVSTR
jgi:shikimate kinase